MLKFELNCIFIVVSGEIQFYWWLVTTIVQFTGWKLISPKQDVFGTDALTGVYTDKWAFSSKKHIRNYCSHYSNIVRSFVLQRVMPTSRESALEITTFPLWPIISWLSSLKLKMPGSWSLLLFYWYLFWKQVFLLLLLDFLLIWLQLKFGYPNEL